MQMGGNSGADSEFVEKAEDQKKGSRLGERSSYITTKLK